MSKKQVAAAAPTKPTDRKVIKRTRRNAMLRKSLPKALKIQFRKETPAGFRELTKVWEESRKKVSQASLA